MKKLPVLIILLALSCNKKEEMLKDIKMDNEQIVANESIVIETEETAAAEPQKLPDSVINNAESVKTVLRHGVMREEKTGQITRTADASMLPFSIGEELKNDNQEFVLKITDYDKPSIEADIQTTTDLNIRINQVKFADGSTAGPFGRSVSIPSKGAGEIWLIVGRDQMASGTSTGHFTLNVK